MKLLKNRTLNIAIIISASWHLICIFSIAPIFATANIKQTSSTVSFLGSILERVIATPEKIFAVDDFSMARPIEGAVGKAFKLNGPETIDKVSTLRTEKEEPVFSLGRRNDVIKRHYQKKGKLKIGLKRADTLISGEVENRTLLYKPELPKVLFFPSRFDSDYNVTVEFKVSRHGFVESPECILSSGSPSIDQMAMRYVRRWQFTPSDTDEAQEGMARISFTDKL